MHEITGSALGGAVDTGMARDVECVALEPSMASDVEGAAVEPGMARDNDGGGAEPGMACDVLRGSVEMVSTSTGSSRSSACREGVVLVGSFSISA
ncbi:unnamed protein product [Closterium sp. Yama58-4]|nr:unnamed protein product [Closterium sp. Yama58-4]